MFWIHRNKLNLHHLLNFHTYVLRAIEFESLEIFLPSFSHLNHSDGSRNMMSVKENPWNMDPEIIPELNGVLGLITHKYFTYLLRAQAICNLFSRKRRREKRARKWCRNSITLYKNIPETCSRCFHHYVNCPIRK